MPPVRKENMLGRAEVRQLFVVPKVGTIAGSIIVEGKASRRRRTADWFGTAFQVYEGKMGSLRRFKEMFAKFPTGPSAASVLPTSMT